ncbi:MAG: alkaline phosphatase family protein [Candidatus Korobacteraceae bacterium]
MRRFLAATLTAAMVLGPLVNAYAAPAAPQGTHAGISQTATPITHLVIIFQENVSFDHYFGTYPNAENPSGGGSSVVPEPKFFPAPGTPTVNGFNPALLNNNPNLNPANGAGATNPFRLDRSQAWTADQDHDYGPEQAAFDGGLMDLFPLNVGTPGPPPYSGPPVVRTTGLVLGYYDGNTTTALWNYAQFYSLNDNFYGTTFGPSTPGALNVVSGQTDGVIQNINSDYAVVPDGNGGYSLVSDTDPVDDVCSGSSQVQMGGQNIGDLLTAAGVTWGFFEGGFDLTITNPNGTTGCHRSHASAYIGTPKADYIPHHQPFQYYVSTQNLQHTRPTSLSTIGHNGDAGNHQYDIHDFFDAVNAGNFPAVSYLKAPGYQDGHAGYSTPLDEQNFIVQVINFLQQRPEWANTAVAITWDDSDGWYDHQLGQIVNQSQTSQDALNGPGFCGHALPVLAGINGPRAQGRCGYGPRIPLLVISAFARQNFVDHTMTDQSSIVRFIEDNWLGGQRILGSFDAIAGPLNNMFDFNQSGSDRLILDPQTGEVKLADRTAKQQRK